MRWTDLHLLLIPHRSPLVSPEDIAVHLAGSDIVDQLHARDAWNWTPLRYAILTHPAAVEVLLRAGANPWRVGRALHDAADVGDDIVRRHSISLIGQCVMYFTCRPAVEMTYGRRLGEADLDWISQHITNVSLAGIRAEVG